MSEGATYQETISAPVHPDDESNDVEEEYVGVDPELELQSITEHVTEAPTQNLSPETEHVEVGKDESFPGTYDVAGKDEVGGSEGSDLGATEPEKLASEEVHHRPQEPALELWHDSHAA